MPSTDFSITVICHSDGRVERRVRYKRDGDAVYSAFATAATVAPQIDDLEAAFKIAVAKLNADDSHAEAVVSPT